MGLPTGPPPEQQIIWSDDPYWRARRLSPAQIQIHDVYLANNPFHKQGSGPWFEMAETFNSTLLPDLKQRDRLHETLDVKSLTQNRHDQSRIENLAREYGWMNCLRNQGTQQAIDDPPSFRKCRWIHISSKFTEYLEGCLVALSDWSGPATTQSSIFATLRRLDQCVQQNERFSRHGRYFSPFFEPLSEFKNGPMLISVPFMDWTTEGTPPPMRFQIDPREGLNSSRSSAHKLRSLLQHYYRLEETGEREPNQVYTRYKPWLTDRNLDLKVRRWYGEYPAGLNVDELWILVVDARHIVTFSSNQSWKSRWPPLQFASRVAEISFRAIRNSLSLAEGPADYSAYTHAVACLSGAVGLMHRSFWSDLPLCLTDRYAGYLSHLQYRLLRSPSTKLVMDLLQVQEELNIIIQLMKQQIELAEGLRNDWSFESVSRAVSRNHSRASSTVAQAVSPANLIHQQMLPTLKNPINSSLADPMSTLNECLHTERTDLCELRDSCNNLINRTIQLVNIRLEDHGKAIMVFTIVTIVFLPLSFVASYFGMNTSDIRNMPSTQRLFWTVAGGLTAGVAGLSIFLAFYASWFLERFFNWRANRQEIALNSADKVKSF
jgi:hypothetical protein